VKIGFDIGNTGRGKTGCGHYADSLIRSLAAVDAANTYLLYPAFGTVFYDQQHATETFRPTQPNFVRHLESLDHDGCRAFWGNPPADAEQKMGSPDLVHSNSYFCPRGLRSTRVVYTLFDLLCLDLPETMPEGHRAIHCHELFEASLRADAVVAISDFSRRRFLDLFPHYPAERTRTVHPASRFGLEDAVPGEAGRVEGLAPGTFWLSVATVEPRKNLRRLLRAYRRVQPRRPLALIGRRGWMEDDWATFVEGLGIGPDLHLLEYVDDVTLRWLYRNCLAFAYVPLAEGFGLPVLEAMALGAPVVASRGSGLQEAAGTAALLADPLDEDDIADAMTRLGADDALRSGLREQGHHHARRFSWTGAAREMLRVYEETLAAPPLAPAR
jgi:glycosyltransferase involved in cell wall biosynthesis